MLKRIIQTIVAGKELEELQRRRFLMQEYMFHFGSFPDIALLLQNMEDTATIENGDHSFGKADTLKSVDLYNKIIELRNICDECEKEIEEYNKGS
jgi:phosphate uptake regulator